MGSKGKTFRNRIPDLFGEKISVDLEDGILEVPVFNLITGLKPGRCSGYVRRAAENLFDIQYAICNAWDRIHEDRLVARVTGFNTVNSFAREKLMTPGMAIGVNLKNKDANRILDKFGQPAEYRHIMLYLGKGRESGLPTFAHQERDRTRVHTLQYLEHMGYVSKVILAPRNQ
jgi:hypothetical protein